MENNNGAVKSMLTGKDNVSFDLIRILGFLGGLAAIIYEGYVVWVTKTFDMANFGIGFGGLMTAIGAGLKIKETTEPAGEPVITEKQ